MQRYYISDGEGSNEVLVTRVQRAIDAGVELVQIREKRKTARELLEVLGRIDRKRSRILVNERMDIAMAANADGLHLPAHSPMLGMFRRIAPPGFLIAASCHSVEDVLRAQAEGADFVVLGPIFETPSKLQYGRPLGLRVLHQATHCAQIPVFALGGITAENREFCVRAGCQGIAGIRLYQES